MRSIHRNRFLGCLVVLGLGIGHAQAFTIKHGAVELDGAQRTYTIYVPDGLDPAKRYPIVMALHGGLGNGERVAQQTGLPDHVDRRGFIGVFPDSKGKQWNDGRETTRSGPDDVAFLVKLVRQIASESGGDPKRVYVAGVSNGGMMVQRLICETDMVAAAAVVIANLPTALVSSCQPKRPVPIVFFNADTDPLMPWAGGQIKSAPGLGVGGTVISTMQTIAFWDRVNGCRDEQVANLPARNDDGIRVKLYTFESCSAAPVLLYEIQGGGHTWPGGPVPKLAIIRHIVGATRKDVDATQVMLDLFAKYGL
jgi:polyhydroxybutyrate depolymerase